MTDWLHGEEDLLFDYAPSLSAKKEEGRCCERNIAQFIYMQRVGRDNLDGTAILPSTGNKSGSKMKSMQKRRS